MKCTDCKKIDVLASPAHTKVGMAHCPRDPPAQFKSLMHERDCLHFKQATEEQKEQRREGWRLMMNPAPRPKTETEDQTVERK